MNLSVGDKKTLSYWLFRLIKMHGVFLCFLFSFFSILLVHLEDKGTELVMRVDY